VAGAIVASFLAVSPASAAATAGAISDGIYFMHSVNSGKCLSIDDSADGTAAFQYECEGDSGQFWYFKNIGGNAYQIVNATSNSCLSVGGAGTYDGAPIIVWTCFGGSEQTWYANPVGSGYELIAANSGKCLSIGGARLNDGAWSILWSCHSGAEQLWQMY
jgi:hypothetical protein